MGRFCWRSRKGSNGATGFSVGNTLARLAAPASPRSSRGILASIVRIAHARPATALAWSAGSIPRLWAPTVRDPWDKGPPRDLVGPPLVGEIEARLGFLERVGLGYLSLDRGAASLSGGGLQRVRLAGRIGWGLVGGGYILDEPTAGLHPRDTEQLLASL